MGLHLGHELLLLHLDDVNGRGRLKENPLAIAYGGAVLAQWLHAGHLVEVKHGSWRFTPHESRWRSLQAAQAVMPTEPSSLATLLDAMQGWRASNRYGPALDELKAAGVVETVSDTVLGLPYRTRWPEKDGRSERALIQRLQLHLDEVASGAPPTRDDELLSILHAVRLLDTVWSEEELHALMPFLDERAALSDIGHAVSKRVRVEETLFGA